MDARWASILALFSNLAHDKIFPVKKYSLTLISQDCLWRFVKKSFVAAKMLSYLKSMASGRILGFVSIVVNHQIPCFSLKQSF